MTHYKESLTLLMFTFVMVLETFDLMKNTQTPWTASSAPSVKKSFGFVGLIGTFWAPPGPRRTCSTKQNRECLVTEPDNDCQIYGSLWWKSEEPTVQLISAQWHHMGEQLEECVLSISILETPNHRQRKYYNHEMYNARHQIGLIGWLQLFGQIRMRFSFLLAW